MSDPRDPGWRLPTTGSAPLVRLRFLFATFVPALATYLVVLLIVIDPRDQWRGDLEPDWAFWILYAVAAAALVGAAWIRVRPLSGTTPQALSGSYTTRFFIGIGFAESAALFGVVIALATSRLWPGLVGLVVSLVGFAMMAPMGRNIDRDEDGLRTAGSPMSLWDALTRPPDQSALGTP